MPGTLHCAERKDVHASGPKNYLRNRRFATPRLVPRVNLVSEIYEVESSPGLFKGSLVSEVPTDRSVR